MRILGNILWIIFGGLFSALNWFLVGCMWCLTIVGIPVGLQCFKMARITLNPFGKEIARDPGSGAFLMNIVWFLLTGWELALVNFLLGLLLSITIIGIPFGKQYFKIAKLALCPFGAAGKRTHFV